MKKILVYSLVGLFILSCSVSAPDNSLVVKENYFSTTDKSGFAGLEKEYKSFSTKALSDSYVSRMFTRFLVTTPNPTQVIRQLEFARYLKDVKSDTSYFDSLKNIIASDNTIYTKITTTSGVPEKKSSEPATFGPFVDSLNPNSSSLILDNYPAASLAYSLRKLRNAYVGSSIRVRRSSDNAEQDIGFVSGALDTTSLSSFVGAGDGSVKTWYDQSGNGNNATQSVAGEQPKIVISGVIQNINGLPVIDFNSQKLAFTNLNNSTTDIFTVLNVYSVSNWGGYITTGASNQKGFAVYSVDANWQPSFFQTSNGMENQVMTTGRSRNTFKGVPSGRYLENWYCDGSSAATLFDNSSSVALKAPITNWGMLTNSYIGSLQYNGVSGGHNQIQEMIIYTSPQSSNRAAIGTNINTFYSIY